ncbi:MAG: site-specific DNA-methyltransferase [Bacteroidia bacterium]|nr:MAG: site-specific DNA-methyltransferase [Bacteroidia bacterium]
MIPRHRVHFKDALAYLSLVPDQRVDLVLTDPPYGQDYSTGRQKQTVRKTTRIANDAGELDIAGLMREIDRVTKPASHCYIFTSWKTIDRWKGEFEKYFVLKNILIWSKDNHTAGDLSWSYAQSYEMILFGMKGRKRLKGSRDRDSVYFPKVKSHEQVHLLQKPERLIEYLIGKSSNRGDVVLDPFAGSGTVGACCARLFRNSIQFEIDPRYRRSLLARLRRAIADSGVAQEVVAE